MTLVVTADDLGLSPGVTRGILEAHTRGVVRSASLMVTFASSPEAAALSRMEPDLEVGLHLDLVGGEPVSDPARVASLCDGEGRFWRLPEFTRRLLTGRIRASDLATEGGVGEPSAPPGYGDDALRDTRDSLVAAGPEDLNLLTDPLLRTALGTDVVRWRVP